MTPGDSEESTNFNTRYMAAPGLRSGRRGRTDDDDPGVTQWGENGWLVPWAIDGDEMFRTETSVGAASDLRDDSRLIVGQWLTPVQARLPGRLLGDDDALEGLKVDHEDHGRHL